MTDHTNNSDRPVSDRVWTIMNIRLIPSSSGGDRELQFLTSFLVNHDILIDAGSAGFGLGLEELARIRHIFISHAHMDHIASLPALLDAAICAGLQPPAIWANTHTIAMLRQMIFNNQIWPDFLSIQTPTVQPLVPLHELIDFEPVQLDGITVTPVPVTHVIPTHGFMVESGDATVLFSSDTGPTEAIWALANQRPRLDGVILEVSFTNQMQSLAGRACHLTPGLFGQELAKIQTHKPNVLAVHLKPWLKAELAEELTQLGLEHLEIMRPGIDYRFP